MGIFKSGREKTLQALNNAATSCAQEAELKFKAISISLEKGEAGNEPYILALKELYKSIFGHALGKTNGHDENDPVALLLEIRNSNFSKACVFYIYLNFMIALIKKGASKYLLRESLDELEKYGLVSKKINELFPQEVIFDNAVCAFVFGTWGDEKNPNYPTVRGLFEDKFNLV